MGNGNDYWMGGDLGFRQTFTYSQETYLKGQKDLHDAFREALPGRFRRFFHNYKVKINQRFLNELKQCYEFAIREKISKGPSHFAHALSRILPSSGNRAADRAVFNRIYSEVRGLQEIIDKRDVGPVQQHQGGSTDVLNRPQDGTRGKDLQQIPVLNRAPFPNTEIGGYDREFSVSSDSLYEYVPAPTDEGPVPEQGGHQRNISDGSEALYEVMPPTIEDNGDDVMLDEQPPMPLSNESGLLQGQPPPNPEDPEDQPEGLPQPEPQDSGIDPQDDYYSLGLPPPPPED